MNDTAHADHTSAWDELIARAKADDSQTVSQAAVFEVFDLDVERLDKEMASIRRMDFSASSPLSLSSFPRPSADFAASSSP